MLYEFQVDYPPLPPLACDDKDVVRSILPVKPGPLLPDLSHYIVHVVERMGPKYPSVRIEVVGLLRVVRHVARIQEDLREDLSMDQ